MRETVRLAADRLRAEVVPSLGGGLARFDRVDGAVTTPVFRPWPAGGSDDPNALALYPLVPWSNRISGGGFAFDGAFHPLAPNVPGEPFPLHGNGWQSAWDVDGATGSDVSLSLRSDGPGPFRYEARLDYRLTGEALTVALAVTNTAPETLPYGLGLHPWLVRTAMTTLEAPAKGVWLEDSRHLPTGTDPVAPPAEWDFSRLRHLPAGWINNGFVGWNGAATIARPEDGLTVAVAASPALSTYVLYSPGADAGFFCFEPVSHAVDAHNLGGGPAARGLVALRPGETMAVECRFAVGSCTDG